MSLLDKAVGFVNRTMNSKAQEILEEVKAECPRSPAGHGGKHVADSFRIMSSEGGAVSASFSTGGSFIKSVIIGSNELGAYYANYGNGGPGRIIKPVSRPVSSRALRLESRGKGIYAAQVHGYSGDHYIERVADRHR